MSCSLLMSVALVCAVALPSVVLAQAAPPPPYGYPPAAATGEPPVPPHVEGAPMPVEGGGFCFADAHPVDTRAAAGPPWHEVRGRHVHFYPPFDLRLFTFRDGCYHFVGNPVDFGYQGQVYPYYGAHPIMDAHGGGWCFIVGAHAHTWRPWSSHFTFVGSWYYWQGPYNDPLFWSYWPYYSYYYRHYYPHYYARGRFHRDFHVPPPIRRVPHVSPGYGWRGDHRGGDRWRGWDRPAVARPAGGDGWRARPAAPPAPPPRGPVRGDRRPSDGWRGR